MFPALAVLAATCALGLIATCPSAAVALWILALATSPDSWLDSLIGGHEATVAALKSFGLAVLGLAALRYGLKRDRYNPALAFAAMFLIGIVHGLYPGLTPLDSVRSLIGSAAPFLFSCIRMPERFRDAVIRATLWAPLCAVAVCAVLAALGLDHLYALELGALRLGGAGQPPFLAGFALIGVYAGLMAYLVSPRPTTAALVAVNFAIVLLTGARAPLLLATLDILAVLLMQRRLVLLAAAGALGCCALIFAGALNFIRVIGLTQLGQATNLSNRNLVWPYFQQAFASSPLFGWGTGAGKVIIPVTSQLTSLLGTNAAHNEYLRIGTEGGVFGLGLLLVLIILWVRRGSAPLPAAQRWLMRLIFIGFAIHSATDNTLIATTSSVFFIWASAIFANPKKRTTSPA
jgi:O-antigen ligase